MAERKLRAKSTHSTIANKKSPTIHSARWEVDFRIAFPEDPEKPISQKKLNYIADVMIEWVKSSKKLCCFNDFLYYQNMTLGNFHQFIPKSEKLKEAYEFTMQVLGTNRERAALAKNAEGIAFKTMQFMYDKQWEVAEERQAKLKASSDGETITKEDFKKIYKDILKDPNNG